MLGICIGDLLVSGHPPVSSSLKPSRNLGQRIRTKDHRTGCRTNIFNAHMFSPYLLPTSLPYSLGSILHALSIERFIDLGTNPVTAAFKITTRRGTMFTGNRRPYNYIHLPVGLAVDDRSWIFEWKISSLIFYNLAFANVNPIAQRVTRGGHSDIRLA